ncbi:MAG TPA: hypothetical protein VN581_01690 [Patescibacteria group bacterium]|nr:hypothetical protein [Patescibacteria group bacterium]
MFNRTPVLAAAVLMSSVTSAFACTTPADLCLNEVQPYYSGSPTFRRTVQYLEFRGPAGSTIPSGTYFVAVDGDFNQGSGTVDVVLDLSGKTIGNNGFLVMLPNGNLYTSHPGATTELSGSAGFSGIAGWSGNGNVDFFERPSTTFFLISAASAPVPGSDIDGNNDGAPDGAHAGWTILDSVGIADNNKDRTYGAINFRVGASLVGSTVTVTSRPFYVGRFGDSFGSSASAWAQSGVLAGSNPTWLLAANAVPLGVANKPLNHVGSSNVWANAAPVNSLPVSANAPEDAPLGFSTANANAISVSDSDAAGAIESVALSVDSGVLSLGNLAGVSIDAGADGSPNVTFSGTLSQLNAALNGLQFTPPADFFGDATLTITTDDLGNSGTDGAKSDADSLTINVRPVNDAPSFTVGADQTVNADAGVQTVAAFATNLSPGPANESLQSIDFLVGNDHNALFVSQPSIAADGTLTYAANPSLTGVATVSVQIHDDGGTGDGGVDTSAVQSFTITVEPPLQPATVSAIGDDDADNLLPLNGSVNFDVDFSRAIDFSSVSAGDFTISGDASTTIDGVTQVDADTVRVAVTATSGGSFQISLTGEVFDTFAMAVNAPFSDDDTLSVDAVAPTLVTLARASANPTNAAEVAYTLAFSEAVVAVDAGDFTLGSSGISGATIASVSGSGSDWTVTVNTGSGNGMVALGLTGAPSVQDIAGNVVASSTAWVDYTIDRIAPLPTSIGKLDADLPIIPFVRFEVVFGEAVTGLDPSDFNLVMGGGIVDALVIDVSGSGTTWTVLAYTGLASGTLGLDLLDDDTITDIATNPLGNGLVGTEFYTIDASQLIPLFTDGFED